MPCDRKKPGVAFWATVVVVMVLVAYPLSFGPACWWFTSSPVAEEVPGEPLLRRERTLRGSSGRYAPRFYWPLGWLAGHGPAPISMAIRRYATLFSETIDQPLSPDGEYFLVRWR